MDLYSNRASFEVSSSRADLIKLLQHNSQRYDWTIDRADKFEASEETHASIHVKSGAYLTARLVESVGNTQPPWKRTLEPLQRLPSLNLLIRKAWPKGSLQLGLLQHQPQCRRDLSSDRVRHQFCDTIGGSKALGSWAKPMKCRQRISQNSNQKPKSCNQCSAKMR